MPPIHSITRRETFETTLLGSSISVSFSMKMTYEAILDFSWGGRSYTFNIWHWKSGNIDKFIKLVHQYAERDQDTYGLITMAAQGVQVVNMDTTQKGNAVLQGCKDIMICLDKIITTYQSSIMDYAMWYREAHTEQEDYSSYITRRTCHCVVHSELLSPLVPRLLVKF
ncbi:hypothetical protein TSOC_014353 [Tetrabaena socialis]|uniref:Uncharacterized protein n=1 Tax=Tetrabaena socialis TaxID=47790 RepID=A0A2J7ZHV6_9CHLO|nr:hypothetical protein TSOC_014353 [Tetrabaena socialis]|eukprot:PNG99856.1 hypothetical protein TSOC_014353 [Tetrabaena socialis]